MGAFDLGWQTVAAKNQQNRAIAEQQRVERQNTVGAQLLDAINNASNIKPQTKDENGNIIHNPEYDTAQQNKVKLLQQYTALNSPEQHASFAQHLHGLIFGQPTDQHQQPALSPNSSPVAPAPPPAQPGATPAPAAAEPPHPMAPAPTNHPLHAITEGISALGNHLKAFANPLPPPTQPDPALMAKYYRDPGEVQFERNKELWGVRGENALALQEKKNEYLKAMLQARPPRLLSQTTIPDLLEQMKVDPTMSIYGPNGNELTPAQLAEMPPGTIAREFRAGTQIFYALGDQNSKTMKVGNEVYNIPAIGPITADNSTALGVANPGSSSISKDQYGNVTTSARTPNTPGATLPPANPVIAPGSIPTLQRRSEATATPSNNPGARSPGTKPAGGAVKSKPISAAAPSIPLSNLPPLDENGHIPDGVGNPQVRQFANDLLDSKDVKDIPAKARAAAEAMARPYGWEQGKFTPKELSQIQQSSALLSRMVSDPKDDPQSLSPIVDKVFSENSLKRGLISARIHGTGPKTPTEGATQALQNSIALSSDDIQFIQLYKQMIGRIQGLSQLTRGSNRQSEQAVQRMISELPDPVMVSTPAEARNAFALVQNELDIALQKKEWGGGGGKPAPRSSKAPSAPSAQSKPEVWVRNASGKLVRQ